MAEANGHDEGTSKQPNTQAKSGNRANSRKRGKRAGVNQDPNRYTQRTRTFPTVKEDVTLHHAITQGAFQTHFDGFRSAFFHTTSILGKYGLDDGANQLHEYIIQMTNGARAEIDETTLEITQAIKSKGGSEDVPSTGPKKKTISVEVPSYVVRHYLSLFPAMDRLIDAIVYAENYGAITWGRRAKLIKTAPSYLRSPAGRFQSLATKLGERQTKDHNNMGLAKAAMSEVLATAIEQHRQLLSVEKKRPLAERKQNAG